MLGMVHSIPIHQDNLKNFKLQAETIILRIKDHSKELKLYPNISIGDPDLYPEIPADKPIQGLGSIVDALTTFQKVLQRLPKGKLSQIRIDLSTLLGSLKERMTSMRCTPKEPTNGRSLDILLQNNATHHITFGYFVLDRLKQFTQKMIGNLDQLKSC
ncbi:hypothetical protein QQF64_012588 [Cirrhinus molitorella]|uniref:Leptin n=1 Tax=Cirrhinus molitorella TaxID=172907 RepID=A0ABR3M002_9TELE